MLLIQFILAVCFLIVCPQLKAQTIDLGTPPIHNFSSQAYKAHSQNWNAVQDPRGIMYFGNTSGILEYDGARWRLIETPGKVVTRGLAISPEGTIFYGSLADFGYLEAKPNGDVQLHSLLPLVPETERQFNDVWQVFCIQDQVYFLTREKIFLYQKGKIKVLAGRFATSQSFIFQNQLAYVDADQGLSLIQGDRLVSLSALKWLSDGSRLTFAPWSEHEILVARASGEMFLISLLPLWNPDSQRYEDRPIDKQLIAKPFLSPAAEFAHSKHGSVYRLFAIRGNQGESLFAMASLKGGVLIFDRQGRIQRNITKATGLVDNTVTHLLQDHYGHLWVTSNSGIAYVELGSPISYYGIAHGIDGNVLTSYRHQGKLYVGSFQQLLVQQDFDFSYERPLQSFRPVDYALGNFWDFLAYEGELLAAGNLGLHRIHNQSATLVANSPINGFHLFAIKKWPGHIFMAISGGLALFQKSHGNWEFVGKIKNLPHNIRRITQDDHDNIWLSSDAHGLYRAQLGDSPSLDIQLQHFGLESGLPTLENLQASFIRGKLFVITPKGLYSLASNHQNKHFQFQLDPDIGKLVNQPPQSINVIAPDHDQGYLVSTDSSLLWIVPGADGQFRLRHGSFSNIAPPDMPINRSDLPSFWLPGERFARVTPVKEIAENPHFQVLLRRIVGKNKQTIHYGNYSEIAADSNDHSRFLSHAQSATRLTLDFADNGLNFEFAAPYYVQANLLQYRYRLKGLSDEWSEWSNANSKDFSYIPFGDYVFEVQARNGNQQLSSITGYPFTVLRPWYLSWWAVLLWLLLGTTAISIAIQLHSRKLTREKQRLEELVAQRTQELREASLSDPLTGLRNRRFLTEVLSTDISAFTKYKNYLLDAKNKRSNISDKEIFGIYLIDLDHFKQVNDQYGHEGGDKVLKEFARILRSSVRQDDVVVRLGGEEFLIILKRAQYEYLQVFAQRLLQAVSNTDFQLDHGVVIHKTCSIGYVAYPFDPEQPNLLSFDQTVTLADLAMYHAKNEGRNRAIYLSRGPQWNNANDYLEQILGSLDFSVENSYINIK